MGEGRWISIKTGGNGCDAIDERAWPDGIHDRLWNDAIGEWAWPDGINKGRGLMQSMSGCGRMASMRRRGLSGHSNAPLSHNHV